MVHGTEMEEVRGRVEEGIMPKAKIHCCNFYVGGPTNSLILYSKL